MHRHLFICYWFYIKETTKEKEAEQPLHPPPQDLRRIYGAGHVDASIRNTSAPSRHKKAGSEPAPCREWQKNALQAFEPFYGPIQGGIPLRKTQPRKAWRIAKLEALLIDMEGRHRNGRHTVLHGKPAREFSLR